MNKIVTATEFKAKCLRLIDEMQKDGQPVTITKRGKPVAELTPKPASKRKPLAPVIGMLKNDAYRFDDPFSPVFDMEEWEANNPAELYRK